MQAQWETAYLQIRQFFQPETMVHTFWLWWQGASNEYMVNIQKFKNTKWSDKMAYAKSVDPDQTAPSGAV